MLSQTFEERLILEDNDWIAIGNLADFDCPPKGRLIDARYTNGDRLRIEFFELKTPEDLKRRYPDASPEVWGIEFPITAVEVQNEVAGTDLAFTSQEMRLGGLTYRRNFYKDSGCAVFLERQIPGVPMRLVNEVFENKNIVLDGKVFTRCTFRDCQLLVAATAPFGWHDCTAERVKWHIDGAAAWTLEFLAMLYQIDRASVEGLFKEIRGNSPSEDM